jgi:hypothetical protein
MGGNSDSGRERSGRRNIDDQAKRLFLDALKSGARLEDAARLAGFSPSGFCRAGAAILFLPKRGRKRLRAFVRPSC